ncbi:MAG: tRNA (adenosine(37)-N6)-threonylcarbamoyltransferase complex transferase subunit TsaD [Endomicrobiales bacterium]
MNILGIESSCDETACAVVRDGRKILSSAVASQIAIHEKYFGVVPELASRAHLENMPLVLEKALTDAGIPLSCLGQQVAAIAYTRGPGLAGALLVGQITAQTLSSIFRVPLIDVNHLEGHLYAPLLRFKGLRPPYLSLVVSGGHTELVIVREFGRYEYLGGTRDDAAGEAFDKVAKLLKLRYPGGPVIDALARKGDPGAIKFPRPYLPGSWDFSFSGLKTAVVNFVHRPGTGAALEDICASFQQAVIDTLTEKTFAAARHFRMKKVVIGGGVASNSSLRAQFLKRGKKESRTVYLPPPALCTDNAAMIACAGFYKYRKARPGNTHQRIEPGLALKDWDAR